MKIPSSSSLNIQCKDTQHHRITGSFGFKDFEGTPDESAYWNKASEEQKQQLKKKHVDTGVCLLCMIDELAPKSPGPRRVVIETERISKQEVTRAFPSKKIVGGIVNRGHERAEASSPNLKVSWEWYNEGEGIVRWTLQNVSGQQASGILFRNSYYFGNAYWPIYANNPGFGVTFAAKLEPLSDESIRINSAPLGIVSWKQGDGSYKSIVSFVFTLSPGQTWRILESGFSHLTPPQNISVFEVTRVSDADSFALGYTREQVDSWNAQTGNSDKGHAPNPNMFDVVQVLAPPEAPFEQLFEGDSIHQGGKVSSQAAREDCLPNEEEAVEVAEAEEEEQQRLSKQEEEDTPIELEASPTTGSGTKSFWSLLGKSASSGKK